MQTIIDKYPFRIFADFETARAIAAQAEADDGFDVYRVVPREDGRFVIAIYDGETGEHLGNHP